MVGKVYKGFAACTGFVLSWKFCLPLFLHKTMYRSCFFALKLTTIIFFARNEVKKGLVLTLINKGSKNPALAQFSFWRLAPMSVALFHFVMTRKCEDQA